MPMNVAPYKVCLVQIDMKNEEQTEFAEKLYETLHQNNIEVLYDNRDERPGVKFKDMDLIGIPLRITIGKKISDGLVEWKERKSGNNIDVQLDEIIDKINEFIKDNLK